MLLTERRAVPCVLPAAMALLFLLLGLAAADAHLASDGIPAGMMRRVLTTTASSPECWAELMGCYDDTSCLACFEEYVEAAGGCNVDTASTCGAAQEVVCCGLAEQNQGCEKYDLFGDWIGAYASVHARFTDREG